MGRRRAELAETLDRVLHKGAVLRGDLVLSVADVDLLYLDVRLFLSSVDKALDAMEESATDDPVLSAPDDASDDPHA
mgnify:CR=1 FL=1|jgi:hypothetical protein